MHPIGLRQFHDLVPLPTTESDEEGFYYFFAQASLRKLLMETLDVVGYRVGQIIYAPVMGAELRKQAEEWYDHLPPPVRFPISAAPLFDIRKSFLRLQYEALHAVILWPSVHQLLESNSTRGHEHLQVGDHLASVQKECQEFIKHCVVTAQLAEELLVRRHLGLQYTIWAAYAMLSMLLITYRLPGLGFIPETRDDAYIKKAYAALRNWEHLPVLRRGLDRSRKQMKRVNIQLDEP